MKYQLWRNISFTEGEPAQPLFLEEESENLESLIEKSKQNPGQFTITNKSNNKIIENQINL